MRVSLIARIAMVPALVLGIFIISLIAGLLESQRADRALIGMTETAAPAAMSLQRGPALFASSIRAYEDAILISDQDALRAGSGSSPAQPAAPPDPPQTCPGNGRHPR